MIKIVDPLKVIESKIARPSNISRTASGTYRLVEKISLKKSEDGFGIFFYLKIVIYVASFI